MTTQQLSINQTPKSSNTSIIAIFFFLIGAPHIYSFLRKRSQAKANSNTQLFSMRNLGLLSGGIVGTIGLLAF